METNSLAIAYAMKKRKKMSDSLEHSPTDIESEETSPSIDSDIVARILTKRKQNDNKFADPEVEEEVTPEEQNDSDVEEENQKKADLVERIMSKRKRV